MRVYFVRHGESENNTKGLWTGWYDAPLTERGKEDAALVRETISGISFDKIYASDLERARETASIAIPGCTLEITPLLREINVGNITNKSLGILTDEQRQRITQIGYSELGGESRDELLFRVRKFMNMLEVLTCERVAVFTHAGWMRALLDTALGIRLPRKTVLLGNLPQ